MNKITLLLAITLLLGSSIARAEDDRPESADLRYCLDLPTAQEIAKCSGEISPGSKGRTYTRQEVDLILSERKANAPASAGDPSDAPATASDNPSKDLSPVETQSGNN